jgi:hypothetical protein
MYLIFTILGLAVSGIGCWHLCQLVEIFNKYGTYPEGEHLFGGGLIVAGIVIVTITSVIKNYQGKAISH